MDGSDCRGYRTTRRNLPSSIAYRPPFTAISRNIGVIDMQTSHTTASAAATTSLARRIVAASWKPVLFAVLMWLSAAAGEIPIPGTPVPITLQTFVVMLAGLMLPWRQAGAAVATYLAAGAVGLPVWLSWSQLELPRVAAHTAAARGGVSWCFGWPGSHR